MGVWVNDYYMPHGTEIEKMEPNDTHAPCTKDIARLQSERDAARRELADADRFNERLRTTVSMLIGMAEGRDVDAVDASRIALAKAVLAGELAP